MNRKTMNLSFHGAVREVTGTCHLVDTGKIKFLLDCGMFQAGEFSMAKNAEPFGFDPKSIDFVLLTHAHADHCGRLPKLCKEGFTGKIFCTPATRDFTKIMLEDSAHVIFEEALAHDRLPLYLEKDVAQVVSLCETVEYRKKFSPAPGITVVARDAGHILGSCFFEIWIEADDKTTKLVFSGDLGNPPMPMVEDTEFADGADVVIMESTYGGRIHEAPELRHDLLKKIFIETAKTKGVLLIPAFALERTQQVLFELNNLVEKGEVPRIPVFVDSPLAIRATSVYKNYSHLYDEQSRKLVEAGDDLFNFPGLKFSSSGGESKAVTAARPPKVIIAGSGMCSGGRIVGHLAHYLNQATTRVLIIGYQPQESVGRQLLEGAKRVRIMRNDTTVKAKTVAIGAYSAHADQPKLLHWVKMMTNPAPQKVFLVHGEYKANQMLADGLMQKLSIHSTIPSYGETYSV